MSKPEISSLGNISTIMDWQHFRGFTMGDSELEIEILSIFLESVPIYITELSDASVADWPSACHKLKGAARTIGAWSLAHHTECAEINPPLPGTAAHLQIITLLRDELIQLRTEVIREHKVLASIDKK